MWILIKEIGLMYLLSKFKIKVLIYIVVNFVNYVLIFYKYNVFSK